MIALHAALLARKTGRPVRMIYDRHEDLSATTKRHPAVIRYRTGIRRDGTIVAQDIDLVMDGGAYTTLTPVVLSRGTIHAGGPYDVANVRIRSRAVATNTPPNGAFRGFGAPQVEFAAEMQVTRAAEALGMSPLEVRRRNVYRPGGVTPTNQLLRDDVAAIEVLDRAAEASEFERVRARTAAERVARAPGARTARGIGLALAWHGAGFTGSGEEKMGSIASLERTGDGRIRILTASTEMGQGTKTIFPQLVAAELGIDVDDVEMAPQDTSFVPDSGPTVASRTAMVVGGLLIEAARRLKAEVEERTGRPFGLSWRDDAREHGDVRIDERFTPYAGRTFDDATYTGDAYPTFGWAAAVAEVEVDLDTAEVAVLSVVAVDDVGPRHPPGPVRGPGRGRHAPGRRLRDDRGDQAARRPLPQRPPRDVPHPDRARRAAHRHDPRRGAVRGRAARGEGRRRAADGRRGAGGGRRDPRRDRRLDRRPARDAGADPRRPGRDRGPGRAGRLGRVDGAARDLPADRQRRAGRGRRARDAPPARRAARGPRPDRHQGGLRRGRVRRLHRAGRRRGRRELPRARVPGRRVGRAHGRGPGAGGRPPGRARRPAGRVPRRGRRPVRDLHARDARWPREAFLASGAEPTDGAIREAIAGNLCRCTGYTKIVDSIQLAARRRRAGAA